MFIQIETEADEKIFIQVNDIKNYNQKSKCLTTGMYSGSTHYYLSDESASKLMVFFCQNEVNL